jgi:hypothetical protein
MVGHLLLELDSELVVTLDSVAASVTLSCHRCRSSSSRSGDNSTGRLLTLLQLPHGSRCFGSGSLAGLCVCTRFLLHLLCLRHRGPV